MALTVGMGPFGDRRAGRFDFDPPAHVVYVEPSPRRVRVFLGGEAVADSRAVKLLHETSHLPVYYFPEEDVRTERLRPASRESVCPYKGTAQHFDVVVGSETAADAAWRYGEPTDRALPIAGHFAFAWDRMDAWMEEEEEVFVHPRDPYHRVDAIPSSRHVVVALDGERLAETRRPVMLFETGLPPRTYIPLDDVRRELLVDSDTHTRCPYKGVASYRSVRVGDRLHEDLAWCYPDPLPAVEPIRGLLCFYDERVERVVDGERPR
jgi:uncharacterized protein (DUF427 family)